jgi:putative molybdopterin biosynthesis protein
VKGYRRNQGIVFRKNDVRFSGIQDDFPGTMAKIFADPAVRMINRNRGSGTRVLLDRILGDTRPPGFLSEAKAHNTVAAAVAQFRADWGMAIRSVADNLNLGFIPYQDEEYDFVIAKESATKPAVQAFLNLLETPETCQKLLGLGLTVPNESTV